MSEQCPKCGAGEVDGYGRQNGPFYECWSHTAIDKEGRAHFEQSFPCVERCALLAERDRLRKLSHELSEGLAHMAWCRDCAESSWNGCEGGRMANEALDAYNAATPQKDQL